MMTKAIIFDFDGTIADTYSAIFKILNNLASEFNYQTVNVEQLSFLKNLSSREIIQLSGIPLYKLPFLLHRVQKELAKQIRQISPIPGISSLLYQLKNQGYILGIVTSNLEENARLFLQNHQLETCFDFIYSGPSLFGKHHTLARVIKQYNLSHQEVIYLGDETRDIRSARQINIGIIAVAWGFNSASILAKYNPDYLIIEPAELLEAISKLENPTITNRNLQDFNNQLTA